MEPKRILVVDDDEAFRGSVTRTLENAKFAVLGAENGMVARDLLEKETVDLVLSDIRMPVMDGLELLAHVKKCKPLPFVLMTGFSELLETQEAHELGADGFVAKPFKREELLELLAKILGVALPTAPAAAPRAQIATQVTDDDFCKVGIDDFISGNEIQYDIYVRLAENKFVKIAHRGSDITVDRIKTYKTKNIRYLYLTKFDFWKYIGLSANIAKAIKDHPNIDKRKKLNFLRHTSEVLLEQLFVNGVDRESYEISKTVTEATVGVLSDSEDAFNLLDALSRHDNHIYAHSLGVSLYSVLIAREMKVTASMIQTAHGRVAPLEIKWNSPETLYRVSYGGLLHDIGKKEIDPSILAKPRRALSPEEVRLIESHPMRGIEILRGLPFVPSEVIDIVAQHHENCDGTGIPAGLKKAQIHPMSRVVTVANEFCGLALPSAQGPGMAAKDAIQKLVKFNRQYLDVIPLSALMKAFGMPGLQVM